MASITWTGNGMLAKCRDMDGCFTQDDPAEARRKRGKGRAGEHGEPYNLRIERYRICRLAFPYFHGYLRAAPRAAVQATHLDPLFIYFLSHLLFICRFISYLICGSISRRL